MPPNRNNNTKMKNKMLGDIAKLPIIKTNNFYIEDLFSEDAPESFKKEIETYNKDFIKKQIYSIKKTLDLINNKPNIKQYNKIIKTLISNATDWCKKYDIEININSKYLVK